MVEFVPEAPEQAAAFKAASASATSPHYGNEQANSSKQPLFIGFDDLIKAARPPEYLVWALIERGTVSVTFGDSDTYKSFAVTDLLLHIAANKSWHGRRVVGGPVLYLNAEGHPGTARRALAWSIRHGINGIPFFATGRPVYIDDDASIAACVVEVDALVARLGVKPVVIAIDTLARSMVGDESSTVDMNRFIANAGNVLRDRYGASIMIVHHTGHVDKKRERGSYTLRGAMDARFLIERPVGTTLETILTPLKMKDAPLPSPIAMTLASVDLGIVDALGEPVTSLVIDRVQEVAASNGTSNTNKPKAKNYGLQILENLISAEGVLIPKIARTYPVVTEEKWREACADNSLSESQDNSSQGRAFRRVRKTLLDTQQIVCKQGYVWLSPYSRAKNGHASDCPKSVCTVLRWACT